MLATSKAAHAAGLRVASSTPREMRVEALLRAVGGSTRRCLRVKREIKKYGFRVGGSELTLRQSLSSRRVAVHGERAAIDDSIVGIKANLLDIVRRVDVCGVARAWAMR